MGTENNVVQRLNELRSGLLRLHKTLLDSERSVYERDVQKITSPGQLLTLVMHDPWFAWLHELSELIVTIDEALDGKEPATAEDAVRFIPLAKALLLPAENGNGFAKHYFEALQRDPDVVLAHGAVMKLFSAMD
jgi:hypothetical protein